MPMPRLEYKQKVGLRTTHLPSAEYWYEVGAVLVAAQGTTPDALPGTP